MHNKYVCSPSSKGGSGVGDNTTGRMPSNTAASPTNESVPSLAGNCSNDGGSDLLYPDSVSESITSSPITMLDKNVCSPSSKGGFGVDDNTVLTNEDAVAGKCSNEGGVQNHDTVNRQEETSKKVPMDKEKAEDKSRYDAVRRIYDHNLYPKERPKPKCRRNIKKDDEDKDIKPPQPYVYVMRSVRKKDDNTKETVDPEIAKTHASKDNKADAELGIMANEADCDDDDDSIPEAMFQELSADGKCVIL